MNVYITVLFKSLWKIKNDLEKSGEVIWKRSSSIFGNDWYKKVKVVWDRRRSENERDTIKDMNT